MQFALDFWIKNTAHVMVFRSILKGSVIVDNYISVETEEMTCSAD